MAYKASATAGAVFTRTGGGSQALRESSPVGGRSGAAADGRSITQRLKDAVKPEMVQVAPGKWIRGNGGEPPEISLVRWKREEDGTYIPLAFTDRLARLDKVLLKQIGLPGQYYTLRRLGRMGCIETIQIAPRVILINLDSWYNHLRLCAEDPFLWEEGGKYLKEYRRANYFWKHS